MLTGSVLPSSNRFTALATQSPHADRTDSCSSAVCRQPARAGFPQQSKIWTWPNLLSVAIVTLHGDTSECKPVGVVENEFPTLPRAVHESFNVIRAPSGHSDMEPVSSHLLAVASPNKHRDINETIRTIK